MEQLNLSVTVFENDEGFNYSVLQERDNKDIVWGIGVADTYEEALAQVTDTISEQI